VLSLGANHSYSASLPDEWLDLIESADLVLMQREVPEHANIAVSKRAKRVILDCGGSLMPLSPELLSYCDIVSPNETEIQTLPKNLHAQYPSLKLLLK
jgi:ribokinase